MSAYDVPLRHTGPNGCGRRAEKCACHMPLTYCFEHEVVDECVARLEEMK